MRKPLAVLFGSAYLCFLAFATPLRGSSSIGAVVQSSDYDATKGITTVHIVNTSFKEISALDLSLQVTFLDGTVSRVGSSRLGLDFLEGIIQGKGGLVPGAVLNQEIPGYPGPVQATVDMVAYSDGTADVLNERAFKQLEADRTGRVRALQKVNEILNSALADSTVQHPSEAAIAQLESMVAAVKHSQNNGLGAAAYGAELQAAIQNVGNRWQSPTGRSDREDSQIRDLIKYHEDQISRISRHADLQKVVRPWLDSSRAQRSYFGMIA